MLRFSIPLLLIYISLLQANEIQTPCQTQIKEMHNSYYIAQKNEQKNEFKKALKNYKKSLLNANKALESCKENPNYNFHLMYDFIIEDEKSINRLINTFN